MKLHIGGPDKELWGHNDLHEHLKQSVLAYHVQEV